MKLLNVSLIAASFVTSMMMSSQVFAEHAAKLPECASVVPACEKAGFKPGDHKKTGHGLWMDCVHKLAEGQPVEGVTVAQADAKTCADAAKAAHPHKHKK